MLKQMRRIIAVLLVIIVMTGCVTMEYDVKINKDGSADLTYIMAFDNSILSMSDPSENPLEEAKSELTKKGFTVEDYKTDTMFGIKAYKKFKDAGNMENLEELLSEETEKSDKKPLLNITDRFFVKQYKFDAEFDLSDISLVEGEGEEAQINNAIISNMNMSFKLTTPAKPTTHNAQTIENEKTLIWDLKPGEVNHMIAEFNVLDILNIILTAAGIILIIVIPIIIKSSKDKKNTEESIPGEADTDSEDVLNTEEADVNEEQTLEEEPDTENSEDMEEKDNSEDTNTDDLTNNDSEDKDIK